MLNWLGNLWQHQRRLIKEGVRPDELSRHWPLMVFLTALGVVCCHFAPLAAAPCILPWPLMLAAHMLPRDARVAILWLGVALILLSVLIFGPGIRA
jgi:hypothetical protein